MIRPDGRIRSYSEAGDASDAAAGVGAGAGWGGGDGGSGDL